MPSWLEDIRAALANVGGVAHYDAIYEEVARIRPAPLPRSWKQIVQRTVQDCAPDSNGFKGPPVFYSVDGIGSGVWGLSELLRAVPPAIDLAEPEVPLRSLQQVYRILRDTELSRKLKALYKHECQICGLRLCFPDGTYYAEAHHVQPLGRPHNGHDVATNIIVVCPNHHVLLDYGAIELRVAALRTVSGHVLNASYVEYHNCVIVGMMAKP